MRGDGVEKASATLWFGVYVMIIYRVVSRSRMRLDGVVETEACREVISWVRVGKLW